MPNPFLGMDPYLEGSLWTSVHTSLEEQIARDLVPRLRPKYVVRPERRIVMAAPDPTELQDGRIPDVAVSILRPNGQRHDDQTTAVADPPRVGALRKRLPIPQTTVEIRDQFGRELVTAIEILSPTNKRGSGSREYRVRRHRLLASPAHFMEIDLIRVGHRFPMGSRLPKAPYFVFLSRAGRRSSVE